MGGFWFVAAGRILEVSMKLAKVHEHTQRLTKAGPECIVCYSFLDVIEPELPAKVRATLQVVRNATRGDR